MKNLILFVSLAIFLPGCTTVPPITGEFTSKDGTVKVHPNGSFEIIVEPRTSK